MLLELGWKTVHTCKNWGERARGALRTEPPPGARFSPRRGRGGALTPARGGGEAGAGGGGGDSKVGGSLPSPGEQRVTVFEASS